MAQNKAPKTDIWKEDPDDLLIVGYDDEEGPPWLNQPERNELGIQESFVESIGITGVTETVKLVRIGKQKFVDSGRQKVKNCREYNRRLKTALGRDDFVPDARTAKLLKSALPMEYDALKARVMCVYVRGKPAELIANDIVSNSHRTDVSPIQRARNFDAYIESSGATKAVAIAECATLAGMTPNAVRQDLELLNLAPELQNVVDDGTVAADTARSAKNAPYGEQKKVATEAKEKRKRTGKRMTKSEAQKNLSSPTPVRRGKKTIKALLAHNEHLNEDIRNGALWALGELSDDDLGIQPAPAKKRASNR